MYLTDVLDIAFIDGRREDVPIEFVQEQAKRMNELLKWGVELEATHDAIFPRVPFAPGFLMYLDYLIYISTTGIKQ